MANGTQYSFQRIEKKYFISPAQAETMLGEMRQHMTADRYGEYAIGNIYCDTDNFPPFFSDFKYSFKRILEYKIPSFISSSSTMESLSKKFSFSLR